MKLYKGLRFKFLEIVPKYRRKRLLWALSLKPGDLINDCSGFNVKVRDIHPVKIRYNNSWLIHDIIIRTEPYGGSCSVRSCGVEPPLSVEEIKKEMIEFYNECPEYRKGKVWNAIKNGLDFCDENGMISV